MTYTQLKMAYLQCGCSPDHPQVWALFDIDWTLIRPEKGTLFTGYTGYRWLPGRKATLDEIRNKGYRIGLVSNAKVWPQQREEHIQHRLKQIHQELGEDTLILAALAKDEYRKPGIAFLSIIKPAAGSFYVGDAAGRPTDHSDVDIKFAQNGGLKFYYPEDIFPQTTIPRDVYTTPRMMILLVGAPGSGKSYFAQQLQNAGWICVSSDDYRSNRSRIKKALQTALSTGKSVVLDATNPTVDGRREYLQLGTAAGYTMAIVHLIDSGEARNKLRERPVPTVAVRTYWSRLEEPTPQTDNVPVYELL